MAGVQVTVTAVLQQKRGACGCSSGGAGPGAWDESQLNAALNSAGQAQAGKQPASQPFLCSYMLEI